MPKPVSWENTLNHIHVYLRSTASFTRTQFRTVADNLVCGYCRSIHPERIKDCQPDKCIFCKESIGEDGHHKAERIYMKPWRSILRWIYGPRDSS